MAKRKLPPSKRKERLPRLVDLLELIDTDYKREFLQYLDRFPDPLLDRLRKTFLDESENKPVEEPDDGDCLDPLRLLIRYGFLYEIGFREFRLGNEIQSLSNDFAFENFVIGMINRTASRLLVK